MEKRNVMVGVLSMVLVVGLIGGMVFWQLHRAKPVTTATKEVPKMQIEDIKVGDGDTAEVGRQLTVQYKGTLTNGVQFDSSYDRNSPFQFRLGEGNVIKGWDQGMVGMKVGGKRKLTIPPDLGYGSQAVGSIPPNSTLVFEVELLNVQ